MIPLSMFLIVLVCGFCSCCDWPPHKIAVPLPKRQFTTSTNPFSISSGSFVFTKPTQTNIPIPPSGPLTRSESSTSRAPLQTWSSISTDLTTPSLCSDNEREGETATEDLFPATPPAVDQSTQHDQLPIESRASQREVINNDIDAGLCSSQPSRRFMNTPPPGSRSGDLFSKRPATSPMPKIPAPKRPRRPTRSRVVPMQPPTSTVGGDDDDDDPLSLSYNDVDDIPGSPSPHVRRRKADTNTRKARRQTLDEEIRIAEGEGHMDSGIFVAVGSRSKKKGFLAGGGAAGAPIFMGVGYVEGAEDSDPEDDGGNSDTKWRPQKAIKGRRKR
jgi:hypothetical protein